LYGFTSQHGVLFEYNIASGEYFVKATLDKDLWGSPLQASNGKIYGVSYDGGLSNHGTLFEYDISMDQLNYRVDFGVFTNGSDPLGGLTRASNDQLYGLTSQGGSSNSGLLFRVDPINQIVSTEMEFNS